MNKQVSDKCDETSMKIIDIIEALGFTVENKNKCYELRTLITNEIRHCVSDVVTDFYNNAALVPTSVIEHQSLLAASGFKETDTISWAAAGLGKIEPTKNEQTNPNS